MKTTEWTGYKQNLLRDPEVFEAYIQERERQARLDELSKLVSFTGEMGVSLKTKGYVPLRLSELQEASGNAKRDE